MDKNPPIEEIKKQSAQGVIFLSVRNLLLQAVSMVGFFILSVVLDASEVGLFAIVAESVSIFGYFSDIGLASALIQKKSSIHSSDLRSSFTIQQILVLISFIIIALTYPSIAAAKHFGSTESLILLSLCFSFFAASLKTIPSVLLERDLNFKSISTVDIFENITFYLVAVSMALLGFGAKSYAYAAFIRSLFGLILMYRFQSWPIGFEINLSSLKDLFKFGIPFQLNSFIAVAKDRFSSLIVAGIIGTYGFGLISWAQKVTRLPLSLMDAIMKVTFPAFSRLQDHPEILSRSIRRSLFFIAYFSFPALAGLSLISSDIMFLIPKYTKWLPALVPLYLFSFNAAIASVTTPITNAFNAVGKITLTTRLMLMWTTLTWIFYPFLSYKFGYTGTAIAGLLVGSSSLIVWFMAKSLFKINIFNIILGPALATILIILLSLLITAAIKDNYILSIILKVSLSLVIYSIYSYFFCRQDLIWLTNTLPWKKSKI